MVTTLRKRPIRTPIDAAYKSGLNFRGWLDGPRTYLWIGDGKGEEGGQCLGTVSGRTLYRLAKAIVKQFENGK